MNAISAKLIKEFGPERVIQLANADMIETCGRSIHCFRGLAVDLEEITSANGLSEWRLLKPTASSRGLKTSDSDLDAEPVLRQGLDERTVV